MSKTRTFVPTLSLKRGRAAGGQRLPAISLVYYLAMNKNSHTRPVHPQTPSQPTASDNHAHSGTLSALRNRQSTHAPKRQHTPPPHTKTGAENCGFAAVSEQLVRLAPSPQARKQDTAGAGQSWVSAAMRSPSPRSGQNYSVYTKPHPSLACFARAATHSFWNVSLFSIEILSLSLPRNKSVSCSLTSAASDRAATTRSPKPAVFMKLNMVVL